MESTIRTHYPYTRWDISGKSEIFPIEALLFTDSMMNELKRWNGSATHMTFYRCPGFQGLPLNKMLNVSEAFMNNERIPPIRVQRRIGTDYYEIVDGRHRVVCSIIEGYTEIPVVQVSMRR